MMKRILISLILASGLAGCAAMRPTMSYVAPQVIAPDTNLLASDAAEWLATALPPAKTTIVLDPPASSQQADAMTPALLEQLRAKGFGVVQVPKKARKDAPAPSGVLVRYLVSPLDSGVLIRLQYQGVEAARFYPRATNGSLVASAPFTVRQTGQQETVGVSQ